MNTKDTADCKSSKRARKHHHGWLSQNKNSFATEVYKRRRLLGLKLKEFALIAKVSHTTLSKIEFGGSYTSTTAGKILATLHRIEEGRRKAAEEKSEAAQ